MIQHFILPLFLFALSNIMANAEPPAKVMLQANQLPVKVALLSLASLMHKQITLSPSIQGTTNLNLASQHPQQLFKMLLLSHHLAEWQQGEMIYVAPQAELLERQKHQNKWQEMQEIGRPLKTILIKLQYARAREVAALLQAHFAGSLKKGYIACDHRTNTLLVTNTLPRLTNLQSLIQQLDQPLQQVVIEARLVNMDQDAEKILGIHFGVLSAEPKKDTNGLYTIAVVKLPDASLLDIKLAALEKKGQVELLSRPSLFTANLEPAFIEAGEEVPYQEASETGATAIVFKKAVLGLKVIPQILPGERVLLDLHINQDRPTSRLVLGMPTIATRQIKTQVLVKNGQTIVLGGIFESNVERNRQQVPILGNLPLIGALFKEQAIRSSKRELLIFITPKLITSL